MLKILTVQKFVVYLILPDSGMMSSKSLKSPKNLWCADQAPAGIAAAVTAPETATLNAQIER